MFEKSGETNFFTNSQMDEEKSTEVKLRPTTFSEFVGQKEIVANIEIMVESSRLRSSSVDHVLLSGPPGLGKTSRHIIASEIIQN